MSEQKKNLKNGKEIKTELEESEVEYLTLDFNGEEIECAIIDEFELNGKKYMVLLPEDEEEAYIYSFDEDEQGEITLNNLEEEEFQIAVELYTKRSEADE